MELPPPLCKECPNYLGLKNRAKFELEDSTDITEFDFAIVALRHCMRGKSNNPKAPCTINASPKELANFLITEIAGKTE